MDRPMSLSEEELYLAILTLKTPEECRRFFDDLCTIREKQDLASRFSVVKLLDEGKNYAQICALTGASTATISRVNNCLCYGENGYRLVLDRMKSV